ncbi:hypothetical protein D3C76_383250 [compost metagenome]
MRTARVLTNKPTKGSSSARPRPATGQPITTSAWPDNRDSTPAQALSTAMYSVTP